MDPKTILGSAGAFLAGGALGYYVATRVLEAKYDAILQDEIAQTKDYYAKVNKADEYETPQKAAETLLPEEAVTALKNYTGVAVTADPDPRDIVVQNVFVDGEPISAADADDVFYVDRSNRSSDRPYIISEEEFLENETDYEQTSLTYFTGDDTLADEADQAVEDIETVIGSEHLGMFGQGTTDSNTVYVRNDKLTTDYEVTRATGSYSVQVLGFIEHSDSRNRIMKFRGDDE